MIWYKRTWRFLYALIHSWTARIPVPSIHFKLKSCTLFSSLLKVKFSGESCSDIESILTILSSAWNKTNSSSQIFRFLGDFLGLVESLKVAKWILSHDDYRYWMYLPRFKSHNDAYFEKQIITHNSKSEINNTFLFSHEISLALTYRLLNFCLSMQHMRPCYAVGHPLTLLTICF